MHFQIYLDDFPAEIDAPSTIENYEPQVTYFVQEARTIPPNFDEGNEDRNAETIPPVVEGNAETIPPVVDEEGNDETIPPVVDEGNDETIPAVVEEGNSETIPPVVDEGNGEMIDPVVDEENFETIPPVVDAERHGETIPPVVDEEGNGETIPPVVDEGNAETIPPFVDEEGNGETIPPVVDEGYAETIPPLVEGNLGELPATGVDVSDQGQPLMLMSVRNKVVQPPPEQPVEPPQSRFEIGRLEERIDIVTMYDLWTDKQKTLSHLGSYLRWPFEMSDSKTGAAAFSKIGDQ